MRASARLALLLGVVALAGSAGAHPELSQQLAEAQAKVAVPGAGAREWWRAAELHRFRREWQAAEAAYARARALDGTLAAVDLDLARMRLEAGAAAGALEALARYTGRRPDDPEGWSVRGRALAALGRHEEASRSFAAALSRSVPTRPVLPDDYLGWAREAEAAGTPIAEVLAGLDTGARRLQGARSLQVAALDLAERHGLLPEALARRTDLEAKAQRTIVTLPAARQGEAGSSDLVLVPKLVMHRPAVSIVRGPYLQRGTHSAVVVRWRTDLPSPSRVRWGLSPGALDHQVQDPSPVTEHVVSLSGLPAETRIHYAVGTQVEDLTGDSFLTAPTPGKTRPLRIWVLGDSGTANGEQARVRDAFEAWTGSRDPDFWLMLGDNAYHDGTDFEYQAAVFDVYPRMLRRSVLWPTLGNHDGHTADSATQSGPYYDIFTLPAGAEAGGVPSGTEAYYAFDWGNVHVIVLDSYETDRSPGSAMLTWLEQDLKDTLQDWIVAVWHHPPYTKGSHDSDFETELIEMRENVVPILEAYGVDLMLSGHSHSYERSFLIDGHYGDSSTFGPAHLMNAGTGRPAETGPYEKPALGPDPHRGAVYAVAGSSGQISGGALDHPAMLVSLNVLGSLVLDVSGNRMDATFLDDGGDVRDRFTLIKAPATLPVADFTASPLTGPAPLTVAFTDRSTNGPLSWSWDFQGDGLPDATVQHPTRVYRNPGLYAVKETVWNVAGLDTAVRLNFVCVTGSGAAGPVSGLRFDGDRRTLRWTAHPRGASYDVVRGSLSALRSAGGSFLASSQVCVEDDGADLVADVAQTPSAGQALYILVRAVECNGATGTWNDAGAPARDAGLSARCP